jgi:hypothetical protein
MACSVLNMRGSFGAMKNTIGMRRFDASSESLS